MLTRLAGLVLVGLGGAAGSALRAALGLAWPESPLVTTLAINVVGAFLLGVIVAVLDGPRGVGGGRRLRARLLLGTGFCGGFTTYSAVAVQTAELAGDAEFAVAGAYAAATLVVGALATLIGLLAGGWSGAATRGPR